MRVVSMFIIVLMACTIVFGHVFYQKSMQQKFVMGFIEGTMAEPECVEVKNGTECTYSHQGKLVFRSFTPKL